nr:hypothetical protein BHI3_35640 [Bacteriovorax sp. HI3]
MLYQIYVLIFKSYALFMRRRHPEVVDIWFRNSLKLGYWAFGKSDIDVTIMVKKGAPELFLSLIKTHDKIKKLLPVMGEVVFFDESRDRTLLLLINPLELKRDPVLMNKYQVAPQIELADRVVFLHKFLMANWSKKTLPQRPEKIAYTLNQVTPHDTRLSSLEELPAVVAALLGEDQKFIEEYRYYLDNYGIAHKKCPKSDTVYCLFYNKICYLPLNRKISTNNSAIMERIIAWELWGCFSNQATDNPKQMKKHMGFLFEQSEDHLTPSTSQRLIKSAEELGLL